MRTTPAVPTRRRNQRGIALAWFGIAMVTFVAFMVIGIDVGRLAFTASEVQSVADAAALAAAQAKFDKKANPAIDPLLVATKVVQENFVDGEATDVGSGEVVESITPGKWDYATGTFTAGAWTDPDANAAKAVAVKTVNNFVAAAIGAPESTVGREAIAATGGACNQRLLMPIALEDCKFNAYATGDPNDPNRCSLLPKFTQAPDPSDNTCWTSLSQNAASANEAKKFLPTTCCQGGNCGGGQSPPLVSLGDHINIMNGQATVLLKIIEDCFNDGMKEWDLPIVQCGKCNKESPVLGFVHIVITKVTSQGSKKGIDLTSVCKTTPASTPGCGDNGTFGLAIVK